jgi:hypothetical protein
MKMANRAGGLAVGAKGCARRVLALALAALAVAAPADARIRAFTVALDGQQEVNGSGTPNQGDPDGTGTAVLVIDDATNTIDWTFTVANIALPLTLAHIHQGAAGSNGTVVVDFSAQLQGSGLVDADLASVIANPAGFYVNLHNSAFPGGALRGQLAALPDQAQIIRPSASPISVQQSAEFSVDLLYTTDNPFDETLGELSIRVHFDSTKLEFVSRSNLFATDSEVASTTPSADTSNNDGDAATDSRLQFAWLPDLDTWPGTGTLPLRLVTLTFRARADFTGSTVLKVSQGAAAEGYRVSASPILVSQALGPDTTRPVITLNGNAVVNLTVGTPFVDPGASALDDRDGNISQNVVASGDTVNVNVVGTYTRRYNVSDAAGNAALEVTRTVNVVVGPDTTAPVVTAPANITVQATSAGGTPASNAAIAAFLAGASATDDRDGTRQVTNNAPGTFPIGATTVTFSASDTSNNTGTAMATVTVVDTTGPAVTAPANITVQATGAGGAPASLAAIVAFLGGATAVDVVDGTRTVTNNAPGTFPIGATTVTFSASDTRGNSGSATATVTVVDTTGPVVTAPANLTVEAPSAAGLPASQAAIAAFLAAATANDAVDGTRPVTNNAPGTFPIGATTVTFSASDTRNNTGTATATLTVTLGPDMVAPVVTAPADITVQATSAGGTPASNAAIAAFLAGAGATDDRDGTRPVTNNAPGTFPIGATTVTFSASDTANNTGTATATVTVVDTTGPAVTAPANITVEATGASGAPASLAAIVAFLGGATAVDVVDGTRTVTNNAPGTFPIGATTVTFSASDTRGNSGSATATVTVVDTTAPTVTAPAAITVEATVPAGAPASLAAIAAFLGAGTATDVVDGARPVTTNAPATLPLGTTTVTFSASDTRGNTGTATSTVTVRDTTAPVLTPPADLNVVETGMGVIARSARAVQAFLAAAQATDAVTSAPQVANDAPLSIPVGTTTVTFTATDAAGNSSTATARIVVAAVGTGDTDGDGMPDAFENANGLDPNDAEDADDDPDNDRVSNLQEFRNGTNPRVQEGPVVTAPADITVDSIGPLTPVDVRADDATAFNAQGGSLPVTRSGQTSPFPPGRHVITYSAVDALGNVGSDEQVIVVTPLVQFGPGQDVGEGRSVIVDVLLNGDPGVPVTVDYTVAGTAQNPADHNLAAGSVVITNGRAGQITFNVAADTVAEGTETVVLTLTAATGARPGPVTTHTVRIVEANLPPVIADILVTQGATTGASVLTGGGTVTAQVLVSDANTGDTATFNWGASDQSVQALNGITSQTFQFNPSLLAAGLYQLAVTVTDAAGASATGTLLVRVATAAPVLSATADTDGDGTNDAADGADDSDGDGIADFQDASANAETLPSVLGGPLLSTDAGLRMSIGQTAFAVGASGAQITLANIVANGGADGGPSGAADALFDYPLPFYDFVVDGLVPGGSARVAIRLPSAIPSGTVVYRKFRVLTGFTNFLETPGDSVSSAPDQGGACPGTGSSLYQPGLVAGNRCVLLRIRDGGPNDVDGAANGRVVDPGAVGVQAVVAPPAAAGNASARNGGGCAVGSGPADPTLPLLAAAAAAFALRRWRLAR